MPRTDHTAPSPSTETPTPPGQGPAPVNLSVAEIPPVGVNPAPSLETAEPATPSSLRLSGREVKAFMEPRNRVSECSASLGQPEQGRRAAMAAHIHERISQPNLSKFISAITSRHAGHALARRRQGPAAATSRIPCRRPCCRAMLEDDLVSPENYTLGQALCKELGHVNIILHSVACLFLVDKLSQGLMRRFQCLPPGRYEWKGHQCDAVVPS